jgi:hypothetical protein
MIINIKLESQKIEQVSSQRISNQGPTVFAGWYIEP